MPQTATEATSMIRFHHQEMIEHLENAREALGTLTAADLEERRDEIDGFIRFLERELKPHAVGEEKHLYPAVDELLRKFGRPTEMMTLDHIAIMDRISRFEAAIDEARKATDAESCEKALQQVRRYSAQIDILLSAHLEKENMILLRLIDEHLSRAEIESIINKMHGE